MTEIQEYKITKVEDFLKVPEDRLEACLAEFPTFLAAAKPAVELAEAMNVRDSLEAAYVWIDDGKTDVTISVGSRDDS